jgi:hypothetical protein
VSACAAGERKADTDTDTWTSWLSVQELNSNGGTTVTQFNGTTTW